MYNKSNEIHEIYDNSKINNVTLLNKFYNLMAKTRLEEHAKVMNSRNDKLIQNPLIQCKNKENCNCKTTENHLRNKNSNNIVKQEIYKKVNGVKINSHGYFDEINNKKLNKCNDNNYKSYDKNKYEFSKNYKPSNKCHKNESSKMNLSINVKNNCPGIRQFLKLL